MTDATGSGYWSSVAEAWRAGRFHSLWRSHSDAVNAALCTRWLPLGGVGNLLKTDLFDEVVGDGLYPTMASRARRVFGIDLSVTVASAALARYPRLHALGADARHLPFADGSFGAVVSTSTLDHFQAPDDIVKSLREIHRVLRAGGYLLLTLDNGANPVVALRNAAPFRLLNCLGLVPHYVGTTYERDVRIETPGLAGGTQFGPAVRSGRAETGPHGAAGGIGMAGVILIVDAQ